MCTFTGNSGSRAAAPKLSPQVVNHNVNQACKHSPMLVLPINVAELQVLVSTRWVIQQQLGKTDGIALGSKLLVGQLRKKHTSAQLSPCWLCCCNSTSLRYYGLWPSVISCPLVWYNSMLPCYLDQRVLKMATFLLLEWCSLSTVGTNTFGPCF